MGSKSFDAPFSLQSRLRNKKFFLIFMSAIFTFMLCLSYFSYAHYSSRGEIGSEADKYEFLARGFASGHTYMMGFTPNGGQTEGKTSGEQFHSTEIGHASFYKGKPYLYFGPVPVLAFYIPYKLLSGHYPYPGLLTVFLAACGLTANIALVLLLIRLYFPQATVFDLCVGLPTLVLGSHVLFNVTGTLHVIAVYSGYFFYAFFLLFLVMGVHSALSRGLFFVLSSIMLGLAVGSRFNLFLLTLFPAGVLYYIYARDRRLADAGLALCQLFIPFALLMFLYSLYNYYRFDSFLELGTNHMCYENVMITHTWRLANVPTLAKNYLFETYRQYFFSLSLIDGIGNEAGYFFNMPFCLPVFGILSLFKRLAADNKKFISLFISISLIYLFAQAGLIGLLNSYFLDVHRIVAGAIRYNVDMAPVLLIAAVIMMLAVHDVFKKSKFLVGLKVIFAMLAIYSNIYLFCLWKKFVIFGFNA